MLLFYLQLYQLVIYDIKKRHINYQYYTKWHTFVDSLHFDLLIYESFKKTKSSRNTFRI